MKTQKQKHTPGPWRIVDGQSIHAGTGEDRLIAHCHAGHEPERFANAHLIAAAPDLLAALLAASTWFGKLHQDAHDGASLSEMKAGVRAAIAKARGGVA